MKLENIFDHTIDVDELHGGWVLDAGCRNFDFARAMVERGCRVLALDADPTVANQNVIDVDFHNLALAHEDGYREFVMHDNPEARGFVHHYTNAKHPRVSVEALNINTLMQRFGIEHWDCVKLDVEGAEYMILREWPGPIANQISIEFHEHCVGKQASDVYERVLGRVAPWYNVVQHERTERYCAGMNYWDSLLVQK